MKYLFIVFSLSLILSFESCKRFSNTYPFSSASKIEVLSYETRYNWDTLEDNSRGNFINDNLILKGKLRLNPKKISERVQLSKRQSEELFDILYAFNFDLVEQVSACYEPRHAFIFYDEKNNAIASIEICLMCSNKKSSKGVPKFKLNYSKIENISLFLKSIGIKKFED